MTTYAPDPKRAMRTRRERSTHFVYECYDNVQATEVGNEAVRIRHAERRARA